ncbi:MAG: hypothetical protein KF805_08455 [Phycisphaeraceae bacterium]|nr:hypothetical protein [Phycisphaeraceae bacterium]
MSNEAKGDPSKAVPTTELVGPAGIVRVNDTPESIAEWKAKGYVTKDEYSAAAQKAAGTEKGVNSSEDEHSEAPHTPGESKPESAKERKAREKAERDAAKANGDAGAK